MKKKILSMEISQVSDKNPNKFEIVIKRFDGGKPELYRALAEKGFPTRIEPWPDDGHLSDAMLRMIRIIKNSQEGK